MYWHVHRGPATLIYLDTFKWIEGTPTSPMSLANLSFQHGIDMGPCWIDFAPVVHVCAKTAGTDIVIICNIHC